MNVKAAAGPFDADRAAWERFTVVEAIDPRIRTRCIACPPDPHGGELWCAWEFTLDEHRSEAR